MQLGQMHTVHRAGRCVGISCPQIPRQRLGLRQRLNCRTHVCAFGLCSPLYFCFICACTDALFPILRHSKLFPHCTDHLPLRNGIVAIKPWLRFTPSQISSRIRQRLATGQGNLWRSQWSLCTEFLSQVSYSSVPTLPQLPQVDDPSLAANK